MSQPTGMTQESHRGEYVVVARRYRPQTFTDLVGQGTVSQALCNAIATDRVGHAYLFTGARGVGKTSTARILAKALNCDHGPTGSPCGECDKCQQIASGEDVDVLEIDGASNRGIDEIRQLRSNVGIRPSRSRFKIYIIDEVHMLTKEAFNALLKTLEEPPDHVKFVFCTTEPGKIPITVLSRCQRFDFAPVKTVEIAERLRFIVEKEGAQATPEALELLARRAAGSMRDSQSLLEQLLAFVTEPITVNHIHSLLGTARDDRLHEILQALIARDAAELLRRLDATLLEGVDPGQMAEQLLGGLRDMMVALVGGSSDLFLFNGPSQGDRLRQMGNVWGLETLLAAVQILDQSVTRMRHSTHPRILLELALVRISELENLTNLAQFVGQMVQSEGRWPATALPAPASAPASGAPRAIRSAVLEADAADGKKKSDDRAGMSEGGAMRRVDDAHATPSRSARVETPLERDIEPVAVAAATPSSSSGNSLREEMVQQRVNSVESRARGVASSPAARLQPSAADGKASPSSPAARLISHRDESEASFEEEDQAGAEPGWESSRRSAGSSAISAPSLSPPLPAREGVQGDAAPLSATRTSDDEMGSEGKAADSVESENAGIHEASNDAPSGIASVLQSLPDWSPLELRQQWRRVLDEINDMTADHAGLADTVAISGPNRLVVRFRQVYNASKSFCERPEKRETLEQTFERVTGCRVRFEFELLKEEPKKVEAPTRPSIARTQLRQQVAKHPWVQRAVELFEAEIVNADRDERPKG